MAGISNINESNVSNLTDEQLSRMDISQLDKVIELLDRIKQRMGFWTAEQNRVAALAASYRRELEKTNSLLKENETLLGKISDTTNDVSRRFGGLKTAIEGGFFNPLKNLAGEWGKADQAANDFGKQIGLNTKAVAQLRDQTIKFANDVHIGAKYNTSITEMIKLQESYAKSVGRNLQLTNNQRETLLATQKVMGENTVEFTKKLENLGIGLERSGELAAKMYNEAAKSGISFEKTSKYVTENLTKVQSYGFKNGVEGLTSMAKKAAEVNLNIAEAFKVADKIQTGGVQEAIKMGANLQVLGGSFAGFGDPMGMLYQGLNDMEGLQDRMVKMFSGLGELKNGQVEISGANRLRVNAAAQAMGISKDEMFNMINRQAVRDTVKSQMGGRFDGDEELKELVLNTATLDKNNNAIVNIGGQPKSIKDVTDKDREYLKNLQKTESEDIKDIAQILRGYTEVESGFGKEIENKKASAFSEIGKFAKGLYGRMGESNTILTIIKDAVLAQALLGAVSSVTGGLQSAFGRGRGGVGRMRGGAAPSGGAGGGMASGGLSSRSARKLDKSFGKGNWEVRNDGSVYALDKNGNAVRNKAVVNAEKSIAKSTSKAASTVGKVAKFAGGGVGRAIGGGVLGGAMTGIGYLADGSFKGTQSERTKATAGTIGATIGGAALGWIPGLGPILGMIGAELGKSAGEWVAKGIDKGRANKKKELTKELNGVKGKNGEDVSEAFASLSDNYSRRQLKKIKKALADGEITEDEMNKFSKRTRKKMAQNDKDLIEKFGSNQAKAKLNKDIEEINAKIEKGNFNMETGEFNLANANVPIEPIAYARGGKVEGPSDINGPGVPTILGGNEFVVKAEYAEKNEPILNAINSGAEFDFGGMKSMPVEPVRMASGGKPVDKIEPSKEGGKGLQMPIKISNIIPNILKSPMAPLHVRAGVAIQDTFKKVAGLENKLEVAPIKLDVSGTIKLDAGGQQVDLNAIINNPAFLTQLSQMVERRLADNINGGNFKELKKNKQHTF